MGLISYGQRQKMIRLLAEQNRMMAAEAAAHPEWQEAARAEVTAERDRKYDRKLARRAGRKGMVWDAEAQAYIAKDGHAVIPTQAPKAPVHQGQLHPGTNRTCGKWCRSDHR